MPSSETIPAGFSEAPEPDIEQYHSFSGLAVAGAVFGVLSVTALLAPAMVVMSIIGALLSGFALWRIAKNAPWLLGWKTATLGLCLSLLFGVASLVNQAVFRWSAIAEAKQVADVWFGYLREDKPQFAHHLELHPGERRPFNERLLDYYRTTEHHRGLHEFANQPAVRALLAQGDRAQVRFYDTEAAQTSDDTYYVRLVYAVTVEDAAGAPATFFIAFHMSRHELKKAHVSDWQIQRTEGGYHPQALKSDSDEGHDHDHDHDHA